MKTEIVKVDPYNIDDALLEPCAHALKQGKLVVFPTETVYGLGVNALDENAVLSVYKAKNRPADNPLIVHVANLETVTGMIENIPGKALELMEAFWPGPLALLFPRPS